MTMAKVPPSRRLPARRLSLPALLLSTVLSLAGAQDFYYYPTYPHGGGLWGSAKDAVDPIARPVKDAVCSQYGRLSDRGRFLAGGCAGFAASRLAIKVLAKATVKTAKAVGIAYIAFEAMEYAGLLKEARSDKNRKLLAQSRDYVLRTADGIRHDVRAQLDPRRISSRVKRGMERDRPGTVGFGTGAFFGLVL